MSIHKIFGPKGIGILYKSNIVKIEPIIYGSGNTNDLNPGTPPLPLIVGTAKALRIALEDLEKKEHFVERLNEKIVTELSKYPDIKINKTKYSIPHILNISVLKIQSETMLHALDTHEIYVSTNTACAGNTDSQSVMAVYNDLLRSKHTLRISLSYQTTTEEVNLFLKYFKEEYEKLNNLKD
jgi:cysteine desulfurase